MGREAFEMDISWAVQGVGSSSLPEAIEATDLHSCLQLLNFNCQISYSVLKAHKRGFEAVAYNDHFSLSG